MLADTRLLLRLYWTIEIPLLILGFSLLAGGALFFVQWSANQVEKA